MPVKGSKATAKQRASGQRRADFVKAQKADRATQAARIKEWRAGRYPMSDWTDEEIRRGRVGSEQGEFYGNCPKLSNKEWKTLRAERSRRVMHAIQDAAPGAVLTVKQEMVHAFHSADRLRAAGMILDRTLGKAPERVIVTDEDPYADMMDDVFTEDRSEVKKAAPKRPRKKQ